MVEIAEGGRFVVAIKSRTREWMMAGMCEKSEEE
jgi:hypothetical protein